jgi:hypothetical protein
VKLFGKQNKKKFYAVLSVIVFLFVFLFGASSAQAGWEWCWTPWSCFGQGAGVLTQKVSNVAQGTFVGAIKVTLFEYLSLQFSVLEKILIALVGMLDKFARVEAYPMSGSIPVVEALWKLFLSFSNTFFGLVLIASAYVTIFDLGSTTGWAKGWKWGDILGKVIFVALLINFSMAIGKFILYLAQIPVNFLLAGLGDISDRLGEGFIYPLLSTYFGQSGGTASITAATDGGISIFVSLFMSNMFVLALLIAICMGWWYMFLRFLHIWRLLATSPIYWMAYILPNTRDHFSKWWTEFISWALFLPYYLLFVYLAVYILVNQFDIMTQIMEAESNVPGKIPITYQTLIVSIMAIGILIVGTKKAGATAKKSSDQIVKSVSSGLKTADKWLSKPPIIGAYYSGIKKGVTGRVEEFKKTGFRDKSWNKLYGGEAAYKRREARVMDRMGVGAGDAEKKQLQQEIESWRSKFGNMQKEQLIILGEQGTPAQRIAALEVLRKRGELDAGGTRDLYQAYYEQSPGAAKDYAMRENLDKMSREERQKFMALAMKNGQDSEVIRRIALVMASKDDIRGKEQIREMAKLFTNPEERRELFSKLKTLGDLSAEDRDDLFKEYKVDSIIAKTIAEAMVEKGDLSTKEDPTGEKAERVVRTLFGEFMETIGDQTTWDPVGLRIATGFVNQLQKKDILAGAGIKAKLQMVDDKGNKLKLDAILGKEIAKMKAADLLDISGPLIESSSMLSDALMASLSKEKLGYMLTNGNRDQVKQWKILGQSILDDTEAKAKADREAEAEAFATAMNKYMDRRGPSSVNILPGEKMSQGGIILGPGAQDQVNKK